MGFLLPSIESDDRNLTWLRRPIGSPGAKDKWTLRGAHLLLQTRTKVLNDGLDEVFRRWYPKFRPQSQAQTTERMVA
jgi:hypothetical protein